MAKKYLEQLTALVKQATLGRFSDESLECKHFFSGAALYANGKICMSLTPVGLAFKLPEEMRSGLMNKRGAKHLRYFPKGPIKRDYIVMPKAMQKDTRAVRHWTKISIEYALLLPKPIRKSR